MGAVDVGIGGDNHPMVAQACDIKRFANAGAERNNERLNFIVGEHFVQPGPLNVEDFTAQRQYSLKLPIAAGLGAAAGAIALNENQLAGGWVTFGTIGQLAQQRKTIECALAQHGVASSASG